MVAALPAQGRLRKPVVVQRGNRDSEPLNGIGHLHGLAVRRLNTVIDLPAFSRVRLAGRCKQMCTEFRAPLINQDMDSGSGWFEFKEVVSINTCTAMLRAEDSIAEVRVEVR